MGRSRVKTYKIGKLSLLSLFWLQYWKLNGIPPAPNIPARLRFRCRGKGEFLLVSTEATSLEWLPGHIRGLSMQAVKFVQGRYYEVGEAAMTSLVRVARVSPRSAELANLTPEMQARLQSGAGCFALVLLESQRGTLVPVKDLIIEGDGKGVWTIRE